MTGVISQKTVPGRWYLLLPFSKLPHHLLPFFLLAGIAQRLQALGAKAAFIAAGYESAVFFRESYRLALTLGDVAHFAFKISTTAGAGYVFVHGMCIKEVPLYFPAAYAGKKVKRNLVMRKIS